MTVSLRPSAESVAAYTASGEWTDELIDGFVAAAAASPGLSRSPALVDGDKTLTYAELDAAVDGLAAGLAGLGVTPHEVVSWQLPNWWEAVIVHHATLRLGAVSNPIVPIYRRREVEFILRQAKSRVVVVPEIFRGFEHAAMVEEMRSDLPDLERVVTVRGERPSVSLESLISEDEPPRPNRSAADPAILLYTSGTTADPKGVVHSHASLVCENRGAISLYDLTGDDRVFMPSPLTHVTGLLYGMQLPSMIGSYCVLQDRWEATAALELIARHRCAFVVAATPFLHGLTYHERLDPDGVASLRVFCCGGADVPPKLIRDAEARLGCLATRVYGSTEYPTVTWGGPEDSLARRAETDGRPLPGTEIRVLDQDGRVIGAGERGELSVRGPERFCGYLIPPEGETTFDDAGWFNTGDMASIDEGGYVRIEGRKKDIILRGGENISAKEVEDLLFAHPTIADVAVVAQPDPVMVERACAFVVSRAEKSPSLAELRDYLVGAGLAIQKVPERLELIDELPKNLAGKVQKFKLRERIRQMLADEGVLVD